MSGTGTEQHKGHVCVEMALNQGHGPARHLQALGPEAVVNLASATPRLRNKEIAKMQGTQIGFLY